MFYEGIHKGAIIMTHEDGNKSLTQLIKPIFLSNPWCIK